jgi:hypothetical protein
VIMLRVAHSVRHMEEQQRIHFVVVATGNVGAHRRPPITSRRRTFSVRHAES